MDQADRLRAISSTQGCNTRVLSVTGGKGGVGKSNIAVNLAVNLSRRGLSTLLIDVDFGLSNTGILTGCAIDKTIEDVMFSDAKIEDTFINTPFGFDLLPGASGVRELLRLDAFSQRVLMDHFKGAMQSYDVVIFDTAPGLSDHVLTFNSFAQDVLVVSHPEPTALMDAYALMKVLAEERKTNRFKLLVNRCRSQNDGIETFKKITQVSDQFLTVSVDYMGQIPEDSAVLEAVKRQSPVCIHSPRSAFSIAIERVADKLLSSIMQGSSTKMWDNGYGKGVGA